MAAEVLGTARRTAINMRTLVYLRAATHQPFPTRRARPCRHARGRRASTALTCTRRSATRLARTRSARLSTAARPTAGSMRAPQTSMRSSAEGQGPHSPRHCRRGAEPRFWPGRQHRRVLPVWVVMRRTDGSADSVVFLLLFGGALGLAAACGSRTGLEAPNATPVGRADARAPARDAAVDAPTALRDAVVPPADARRVDPSARSSSAARRMSRAGTSATRGSGTGRHGCR